MLTHAPSGTVVFLMTDIEGSTKLWVERPQTMFRALQRHHEIIAELVRRHEGHLPVDQGEGDSTFSVFERGSEALACAVEVQQRLGEEDWGEGLILRVRMALHAGEVEVRAGAYHGTEVGRCSALRAIAHGGQVLLSQTVFDLVRDAIPPDCGIRDVGEHRLKDLARTERVYQLLYAGMPHDLPPLRSVDQMPQNLTPQLTSFIGRNEEMERVVQLLRSTRLVTLTGPGGSGKTRLASQVGAEILKRFHAGVWMVELAPVEDPSLVPEAIASALGMRDVPNQDTMTSLAEFLREKQLLLILDNFEHLLEAAAFLTQLLEVAAELRILVTSRAVLHVRGEQDFSVPPLSSPSPGEVGDLEFLTQYESVQLFIDRARLARPDFAVTNENAAAVAEICHRLEGLPLAIELAAARTKILPPQALLARLSKQLDVLTSTARDLPARQRTLRGAIEWSYELLNEAERGLLARLSLFAGDASLGAIESVCGADGGDVLDDLASLVDKSLVLQIEGDADEPRFVMLEIIKEYGRERLVGDGEYEPVAAAHARFFMDLAERSASRLAGPEQASWLGILEKEHVNLQSALGWLIRSDVDEAYLLAHLLQWFWWVRGHLSVGRHWFERVLAAPATDPMKRSRALSSAGALVADLGDKEAANAYFSEAAGLAQEGDDPLAYAWAVTGLGHIAYLDGEREKAVGLQEEALNEFNELGDLRGRTIAMTRLGMLALRTGDFTESNRLHEEILEIRRGMDDTWGIASVLNNLGYNAILQDDPEEALPRLEEALRLFRDVGFKEGIGNVLDSLALVASAQGDWDRATSLWEECLQVFRSLGYRQATGFVLAQLGKAEIERRSLSRGGALLAEGLTLANDLYDTETLPYCFEGIAGGLAIMGEGAGAAFLFGFAEVFRAEAGEPLPPVEQPRRDAHLDMARRASGRATVDDALARGAGTTRAEAVRTAHEGAELLEGSGTTARQGPAAPGGR